MLQCLRKCAYGTRAQPEPQVGSLYVYKASKTKLGKRRQSQARTYCNNTVVDPEASASGLY